MTLGRITRIAFLIFTGRFAKATGDMTAIGKVDLVKGTFFRYSGEVCFAAPGNE